MDTEGETANATGAVQYELLRPLGVGGMAEVHLAMATTSSGLERRVAIKRMLPALSRDARFVGMFRDEVSLAMRLSHGNIVHVYDVCELDGAQVLVMEPVEGTTLRALIQGHVSRGEGLPLTLTCFIGMEICKALTYAHGRTDEEGRPLGIIHRDVTPPNILLAVDGQVKLTDFGLARALSQATITEPGIVKGKVAYLAPETARGEPADQRGDIFSLGVCLWEMVAGRRLFLGRDEEDSLARLRQCNVPSLAQLNPAIPGAFDTIVRRALASDPKQRTSTARELGQSIARFLADNQLSATPYDLATALEPIVAPLGAQEGRVSVDELMASEMSDLERLGEWSPTRLLHDQPLDPDRFAQASPGRQDYGPLWASFSRVAQTPMDRSAVRARTPTLEAMESAASPSDLAEMLEGGTLVSTQETYGLAARTVGSPGLGGSDKTRWIFVAFFVAAAAIYVFFGL